MMTTTEPKTASQQYAANTETKEKMEKKAKSVRSWLRNPFKKDKQKAQEAATKKAQKAEEQANTEAMNMRDVDKFFENFDAKRDRKKLDKKMRARIIEAEKLYREGTASVTDMIAPASVEFSTHNFTMNGMKCRSFFVFNYPRYLESSWLSSVINFDVTMDTSIFIYPTSTARIMRKLKKRVTEMIATKRMHEEKGIINDVGLDAALADAQQLRQDLQMGVERFFQVGIYFTLYCEDDDKLKAASQQLETILGGQLVMTRSADFRMERASESTLPQCTDMLVVQRNMNTAPLSTTFPFVSSNLTSNEGILYGLNRHNNSLVIFDRFNLENANSVVFSKSGGGKSYAIKLEILRSLMMGTDVIVLDPENEYQNLCHTVGGTYINVSLNSQQRINPFDLPIPIEGMDVRPGDLLRENIISMLGLMGLMLGHLTPLEEGIMDKAMLQTYALKGITPETENPQDYEMPTMADLKNVLESMDGGASLAIRLEKFTTGTFAGLFSDQTNVDLSSGLVVFSIRDLEEKLRPISMYILLNFIWNKVRSQLKRRLLVIDEAWNIVQYEDSGRFLHNLVKRARKYYLGITTITQDVEDFMKSPWGKPIITNSSMQILLRQAPSALGELQKVFNLTEGEKYLLLNSGVGQGLFFAGNQHVAIQIIRSFTEHKIVTSNPEEVLEMRAAGLEE